MTAEVLDDLDARPGSATSLLRTVVGTAFRAHGGWLPTGVIVACLDAVGVPDARARTALARVKARGLLVPERRGARPGYRLADGATAMLARGDRRIHHPRTMDEAAPRWCLISFSIPETQRDARHQLRKRLAWIGAGTVTPALWIVPDVLRDEVEEIVADLGLADRVTLFTVDGVHTAGGPSTAERIARWWDLDAIRALHDGFLRRVADLSGGQGVAEPSRNTREAFALWIRVLDAWRPIPYLDPGLPASLLPADWPGRRSTAAFLALRAAVEDAAAAHVRSLLDAT